jgi:hypothetical protein
VSTAPTPGPLARQARFTATRVQSLKPGRRQRDVSDPECRGLTLRIEPNGSKTWLFRYKWRKQTVRLSLGALSEYNGLRHARKAVGEHRGMLERGIDPRTARAPRRPPLVSPWPRVCHGIQTVSSSSRTSSSNVTSNPTGGILDTSNEFSSMTSSPSGKVGMPARSLPVKWSSYSTRSWPVVLG